MVGAKSAQIAAAGRMPVRPYFGQFATNCAQCSVRKHSMFASLNALGLELGEATKVGERRFAARVNIYTEGGRCGELYTLKQGWAIRYKTLYNGSRQILDCILPGDLIGLVPTFSLDYADHSVETVTEALLCAFSSEKLYRLLSTNTVVAARLVSMKAAEMARIDERMTGLGRRSARERVAHLLLELYTRLQLRSAVSDNKCPFPLNQSQMADSLGLTTAHINRVLRDLRKDGLAMIAENTLTIHNIEGLEAVCDYNGRYLLHEAFSANRPNVSHTDGIDG